MLSFILGSLYVIQENCKMWHVHIIGEYVLRIFPMGSSMDRRTVRGRKIHHSSDKPYLPQLPSIQKVQSMHDGDAINGPHI